MTMRDDYGRKADPGTAFPRRPADLSGDDYPYLQSAGFVELAACLGFPQDCTRMVQATWPQVLLCMGSRVDEERHGALSCDCVDAEGLPPTETRQAWVVAARPHQDRSSSECCWIYRQVLQQGGSTEFIPERIEDARAWWLRCLIENRNAMVVRPAVGSTMAYKHHRRSASDGRWFRVRRYWGVESIPLASILHWRENSGLCQVAPQVAKKDEQLTIFQTLRVEDGLNPIA